MRDFACFSLNHRVWVPGLSNFDPPGFQVDIRQYQREVMLGFHLVEDKLIEVFNGLIEWPRAIRPIGAFLQRDVLIQRVP